MDAIRQLHKQHQQLLANGVGRDTSCGQVTIGRDFTGELNENAGTSQENCMKMQGLHRRTV
jgi:hypothetical protein